MCKLKGHCTDPTITPSTPQKGNWCADFHAGMAVVDIPEAEATEIHKMDRDLWAIQERLVDILCEDDRSQRGNDQATETYAQRQSHGKGTPRGKSGRTLLLHEVRAKLDAQGYEEVHTHEQAGLPRHTGIWE